LIKPDTPERGGKNKSQHKLSMNARSVRKDQEKIRQHKLFAGRVAWGRMGVYLAGRGAWAGECIKLIQNKTRIYLTTWEMRV
jgi:hypothetical protein